MSSSFIELSRFQSVLDFISVDLFFMFCRLSGGDYEDGVFLPFVFHGDYVYTDSSYVKSLFPSARTLRVTRHRAHLPPQFCQPPAPE